MRVGKQIIVSIEINKEEANTLMAILTDATEAVGYSEREKKIAHELLSAIKGTNLNN